MQIIEQYINSKTGDLRICEDSIVVTEGFVAIVDGATSKSGKLWDGKTSGKVASDLLSDAIKKLPQDCSASTAMASLNSAIADWYRSQNIYDQMQADPAERATASVAMYSEKLQQIWLLSDCQAMIDGGLITNTKSVDTLFENLRAFYLETELSKGKTVEMLLGHDTGNELIKPLIAKQSVLQNTLGNSEFFFDVLDGFFSNEKSIKVIAVPQGSKEIVLASDGYPFLKKTLSETEAELKQVLKEDPLCFRRFRATKGLRPGNVSFDDRSYIRVKV